MLYWLVSREIVPFAMAK